MRSIGYESDARRVLIEKHEQLRKFGELSKTAKAGNWFLGKTIGHGYKPQKSLWFIVPLLIIGCLLFYGANYIGVMSPSKERVYMSFEFKNERKLPLEYPEFNSFIYSIDVFVPFVDLHQEDYWLPDANKPWGKEFRIYFWIHILLGWIFSTLAAASLTGLIRKE